MNQPPLIKYYAGLTHEPNYEIDAETIQEYTEYEKAFYKTATDLQKIEQYSYKKLFRVVYYAGSEDALTASHSQHYSDVPFLIRRTLSSVSTFWWELVQSFTSSGNLQEVMLILHDNLGFEWMELKLDCNRTLQEITKYFWEDTDQLRYIFSYRPDGTLVTLHDLPEGDYLSFQAIRDFLSDPDFFASGFTLPQAIATSSIPFTFDASVST